jgi:hypothetical protein
MAGTKDTRTDLVDELRRRPATPARDRLMLRASAGAYHCFDSASATPKVDLVRELEGAGLLDLAARVRRGEFDEPPSATQRGELLAALRASIAARGRRG